VRLPIEIPPKKTEETKRRVSKAKSFIKYEFFSHTADVKFRAYGKNLEELFSNSAEALTAVLVKPEAIAYKVEKKLMNEAPTIERLFYDFLEEFLYLMDTEGFICSKITYMRISERKQNNKTKYFLEAESIGDFAKNYNFSGDIKSITYHDLLIKKETRDGKEVYMAQVVVDV
jgi:SHS2 domain-containing protein